jgi:hypothetical protein
MQGGKEEPCVSFDSIRDWQARTDQLCPLVELLPTNRTASELAVAAVRIGADHPLWQRLWEILTEGMSGEDRMALLYRVLNAVADPGVAARVKRLREPKK